MSDTIITRLKAAYMRNPASALALLPELFEAEERIVELPCKVGTPLFGVCMDHKTIVPFIADEFIWSNNHWFIMGTHGEGDFPYDDCYSTRTAAEQALKEAEK